MRRRDFISLLAGAAVTWPLEARAQQPTMPVVGFLNGQTSSGYAPMATAFRKGLSKEGFVEGRNVSIEYRWAENQIDRLPALAAELVRRPVSVIAAAGTSSALAAKASTTTIPVVFSTAADPVALGLVASLSRPGGNVTGVTNLGVELLQKQLEMLREFVPTATTVAGLVNPTFADSETQSRNLRAAARKLGLQLHLLHASAVRDFDMVFETMVRLQAAALVVCPDAFFASRRDEIAALAVRHAIPTTYHFREFAAAGGLMSYGPSATDGYRQVGIYAGRILKGEQPAALPVMQSTKLELVINVKTAKRLGLNVPSLLLERADEVIE
jgi:putative ABC transport system substrate-binding protein